MAELRPRGLPLVGLVLVVLATGAVLWPVASMAQTAPAGPAIVTVDRPIAEACRTVVVTGSGFKPAASIDLSLTGKPLGAVPADASGGFTYELVVPCSAASSQITLAASDGASTVPVVIAVQASGRTVGTSPPQTSSTAPPTSFSSGVELAIRAAVLLVGAGGLVVLAMRRREREEADLRGR